LEEKTMDKRQENRQTMWETVEDVLDINKATVDTIPSFAESVAEFKTKAAAARLKIQEADTMTKGKTKAKDDTVDELIASLVPAISTLRVYARKEKKTELEAKATLSPSEIRGLRDTELKDTAGTIIGLIEQEASGLLSHGMTADKIALLKTRFTAYCNALSGKEGTMATRNSVRESAETLIAEVNTILLKEIDEYMDHMAEDSTDFYNAYWAARPIHILGVRHKQDPTPAKQKGQVDSTALAK
jgi:hypothetical protein